ncbi:sodium/calcium exchange proteins [Desulfotalea psychrophila]|uniref:Related to sodium/calcium exchange proteins (Partial length) n=1 Tax=Desulfotalea psychrophila (strain LSv54 / DSM 12343) TaxID=177439 RepID=Q6AJB8_DESPS|nr:sodium/calcium exchange proteins [Desulfotalea psychrophila]CAG37562.1 related to sodium/calcium exchange proteins (partial length) [Desulfotalea psychrophila LSv54]
MRNFLISSVTRIDLVVWLLVISFFLGSAVLFNGDLPMSFLGAAGIIFEMLLIGMAVEIIIECLKNTKGIGTLTGFITNGPEAITLIVGLVAGDIIFAASTPLGSNFMNPILLLIATLTCGYFFTISKIHPIYTIFSIGTTALLAGTFFLLPTQYYLFWGLTVLIVTVPLFIFRPKEEGEEETGYSFSPRLWILPAILILCMAGYFLDPIVSFTAEHSKAPKNIIGFIVLATLTSWPEFKSCLALLKRNNPLAAILNIVVSNITNIWLAVIGVGVYLFNQ